LAFRYGGAPDADALRNEEQVDQPRDGDVDKQDPQHAGVHRHAAAVEVEALGRVQGAEPLGSQVVEGQAHQHHYHDHRADPGAPSRVIDERPYQEVADDERYHQRCQGELGVPRPVGVECGFAVDHAACDGKEREDQCCFRVGESPDVVLWTTAPQVQHPEDGRERYSGEADPGNGHVGVHDLDQVTL